MSTGEPNDQERYPLLGEAGRRMLDFLREHPDAPVYRNHSGNRLDAEDLAYVRREEAAVLSSTVGWPRGGHPDWLGDFVDDCCKEVPHYAAYAPAARFEELPTISRADLGRDIAAFVPDPVPLDRMINFQTSGTTGHPLLLASHPRVAAGYLAYHKRALRRFGVSLTAGRGDVGVVLLGHQLTCFTYVSVTPSMDEAGLAKINLHPAEWRSPADRAAYLEALAPEVIAGDPISFTELLLITPKLRPKAILSTSMTLLPGLRGELEKTYDCPVLDLYSLNEAGPVAVFDPALDGHVLLQPRMFVEILDDNDHSVPHGKRGEITLTGGFNFCLPLLRYRTGDFAALDFVGGEPVLRGLEGRPLVRFRRPDGEWLNNIDVTHVLRPLPLARFSLHQRKDGGFDFSAEGPAAAIRSAHEALAGLFGPTARIDTRPFPPVAGSAKVPQYSSAFAVSDA
ncbi:MAG: capsule biosynthesis protein CapK [Akkermansiaceae bacterium]|nr:capsule biosynthesis protein CapK [Akkermansiaceae bacterium]